MNSRRGPQVRVCAYKSRSRTHVSGLYVLFLLLLLFGVVGGVLVVFNICLLWVASCAVGCCLVAWCVRCADVFWTFNLSEGRNPLVTIMLGLVDADGRRHVTTHTMNSEEVTMIEQVIAAARDPYRVAEWYQLMLNAITEELLVPGTAGGAGEGIEFTRGILGTLVAFFAVNECAQRLSLHTHLKAWVAELRFVQRASQQHDATMRHLEFVMAKFVESLCSACVMGADDSGTAHFHGTAVGTPLVGEVESAPASAGVGGSSWAVGRKGTESESTQPQQGLQVPGTAEHANDTSAMGTLTASQKVAQGGGFDGVCGSPEAVGANEHVRDITSVVDRQDLSACDKQGYHVSNIVLLGVPKEEVVNKTLDSYYSENSVEEGSSAETEVAFGRAWYERVEAMAREKLGSACAVAKARRQFVDPAHACTSKDRNDVYVSSNSRGLLVTGTGAPRAGLNDSARGVPRSRSGSVAGLKGTKQDEGKQAVGGVSGRGRERSSRQKKCSRPRQKFSLGIRTKYKDKEGVDIGTFELECATTLSRIEIQTMMHGNRVRTSRRPDCTESLPDEVGAKTEEEVKVEVRRECTACCHKTLQAKRNRVCRLRFGEDGRAIIEYTCFDANGVVRLARNHGHLVPSSKTATLVLRCNNSLELSFYGRDSLALSLYVTSYFGKGDLSLYEMSLLLVAANERTDEIARRPVSGEAVAGPVAACSRKAGVAAAVRMLNAVSGGQQIGGVWLSTVHGGMDLEKSSHGVSYMKTIPFMNAAELIGPVAVVDEEDATSTYSAPVEVGKDEDRFVSSSYLDYIHRYDCTNDGEGPALLRMSAFEWTRWYNPRVRRVRGVGRDDSSRVFYDSTHNIVGDSFCQSMYKRPFMLNYQGVQLPGLENAEARAQWIVALHVPYIGVGGLSELYAQGYAKDANKPWAAALAVGNALLDMAVTDMVKPPVGVVDTATGCGDAVASSGSQSCKSGEEKKEDVLPATSMGATVPGGVRRKVLVVRRGQGLRWAAAGSGWTRLMYPGTDDGPVWLPSAHKRSEVESGVVDRTAWVNRYVRYAQEMFEGSDSASRLQKQQRLAQVSRALDKADAEADGSWAGTGGGDWVEDTLPPGVTSADRDLLESLLLQRMPSLTKDGAQGEAGKGVASRIEEYRSENLRKAAHAHDQNALCVQLTTQDTALFRRSESKGEGGDASAFCVKDLVGQLCGPFPREVGEGSSDQVCSALRKARDGFGKKMPTTSSLEVGTSCVRVGEPVISTVLATVGPGTLEEGLLDGPGAGAEHYTYADAVYAHRLNLIQACQFAVYVAAFEVEVSSRNSDEVGRSARGQGVPCTTWFDKKQTVWKEEVSLVEFLWLKSYMLEKFSDGRGHFQVGAFATGGGGVGKTHVVKCFRTYLHSRSAEEMLLILCPTGKAAVGSCGVTVWSGLGYGIGGPGAAGNSPTEPFLARCRLWKDNNVKFVVLDEIGMLGAAELANIDQMAARLVGKNTGVPFGGLHVFRYGCFAYGLCV